ncbi:MAG: hypothetical protein AB7O26_10600 [Planctomycetaceae bacterium]
MSLNMARVIPLLGSLLLTMTAPAQAQYFGNPCACATPVVQPCYQTVPITEMRECRQTVQRPVVETAYVDQPVTTYEPVTEVRTCQVPTVSYQTVTECQPCTRNMGFWQTTYQCNPKIAPCAYDPRPGFAGWWNRTGYSMRQAFTPAVTARRQYVPNYVTTMIPVTRQVAVHGTQQVSYNVTQMVAKHSTRKVAVNTVRYVSEEVVTKHPVTVYRTVPIGSALAFAPGGFSATASAPRPDSISNAGAPIPSRSASSNNNKYEKDKNLPRDDKGDDAFENESKGTMLTIPPRKDALSNNVSSPRSFRIPSAVRVAHWTPRAESASSDVPGLVPHRMAVADYQR